MTEQIAFDPYSIMVDFYDHWMAHTTDDIAFYVKRASEVDGPVIELGAGHGRIAIPVAKTGQSVIAVDVSHAMLAEGERRAAQAGVAERITWIREDMRTFLAEQPVDLVYIPATTFLHLLTTADQLRTLDNIARSLRPGGRFICNFFTPDPRVIVERSDTRKLQTEFPDERGRRNEIWAINTYDLATQQVKIAVEQLIFDDERLVDSTGFDLHIRMIYRYEFEHLLARAGLEPEALYGGFSGEPYDDEHTMMVWVARKP